MASLGDAISVDAVVAKQGGLHDRALDFDTFGFSALDQCLGFARDIIPVSARLEKPDDLTVALSARTKALGSALIAPVQVRSIRSKEK